MIIADVSPLRKTMAALFLIYRMHGGSLFYTPDFCNAYLVDIVGYRLVCRNLEFPARRAESGQRHSRQGREVQTEGWGAVRLLPAKRKTLNEAPPKFLVVCAAIAVGVYGAYLVLLPTVYLRYRLTLDVDVDGERKTGSGVVEIAYQPLPDYLSNISQTIYFSGVMRGYAITVDLGERGLLFVVDNRPLIENLQTHLVAFPKLARLTTLPFVAYGLHQDGVPSEMLRLARSLPGSKAPTDVPPEWLPMIVRFGNINDPNSIYELDPRDLAATYGPRVKFAGAHFEFTTDPVSAMPSAWPMWLASRQQQQQFVFENQRLWASSPISIKAFEGN